METSDLAMEHGEAIHVTVRAPNGASEPQTVRRRELVSEATKKAVDKFVAQKKLAPGEYDLALVRDGQATAMASDKLIGDYGVRENDVLHIVPRKPQVDG